MQFRTAPVGAYLSMRCPLLLSFHRLSRLNWGEITPSIPPLRLIVTSTGAVISLVNMSGDLPSSSRHIILIISLKGIGWGPLPTRSGFSATRVRAVIRPRFDRQWHGVVVVSPRLETCAHHSPAPGFSQRPFSFIL